LLLDSLDGVLSCPLSGGSLVTRTVSLVDMCDLGNERVVRVGVGQHGADGKQDCGVVLVTGKYVNIFCHPSLSSNQTGGYAAAYLLRWSEQDSIDL
jgi:hypothetical protein